MAKTKAKKTNGKVPENDFEANDFIAKIAEEQRSIEEINRETQEAIDKATNEGAQATKKHSDVIEELFGGLTIYAKANRKRLTSDDEKKTVTFPSGVMKWRMNPPKVNIRDTDKVIEKLKEMNLKRFIRTIEEPDKDAMLKEEEEAKRVPGVSITQTEEFKVVPNGVNLELTDTEKLSKIVAVVDA